MILKDRVAIVTGSATGIGRGIALKLAGQGCSIMSADIKDSDAAQTVRMITAGGGKAIFMHCNVTRKAEVEDMVEHTLREFGKVDILVNCAGGVPGNQGLLKEINEEVWQKVMDLDLKSVFLCCQAVVPYMQRQGYGKIVNISSIGACHPSVSVNHYHAAKAGVLGLTYNLAFELAPQNITVNAILPGPVRTPFWDPVIQNETDPEARFSAIARKEIPMQRLGTPEDIAGPALFLVSEMSSYVTGQVLFVAGGQPLPVLYK
ncbi:MAG TPA: SDR family NAD(P)-dependent oxidoreductase [Dehalococcoidales bacterium]|nr:SDR family NAD(P)-dependent oxidoreductase [Dehalococcoidales bacterium]